MDTGNALPATCVGAMIQRQSVLDEYPFDPELSEKVQVGEVNVWHVPKHPVQGVRGIVGDRLEER
jgi:hypothetical protein